MRMNEFHKAIIAVVATVCVAHVANAQQPGDVTLQHKVEAVFSDDQLGELEKLRKLQKIIAAEQARVTESHIDIWIAKLNDADFGERQKAQDELTFAGVIAIDALTEGVLGDNRERQSRCFRILTVLARAKDKVVSAKAMEAFEQVASSQSQVAAQAASTLVELTKTDKERAVDALKAAGARVFTSRDRVSSVTFYAAPTTKLMRHLRVFPTLRSLTIKGMITDGVFEELVELNNFSTLNLSDTAITEEGLAKLATINRLEGLHLSRENVTTIGLRNLGKSPKLRALFLREIRPTPDILAGLKEINLKHVTFTLEKSNDEELAALGTLTNLFTLRLNESPDVTDEGLAPLLKLSSLHSLTIEGAPITNDGIRHLSKLTTLSSLTLYSALITDEGLEHLKGLHNLEYVILRGTHVTDKGAEELQKAIPGIRRIFR